MMDFSQLEKKQPIFGKSLSYNEVKNFKTVEVFADSSHDTRSLQQDEEGNFYLYDFHEIMNFSGGEDTIYEHIFFLESEEQGRKLARSDIFTLKTKLRKYIWIGPGFDMKAVGN